MDVYFDIRNLKCSYNKTNVVLWIKELTIPRGEVVFIVGQSGCGKSTILETLGLMNNTIVEAEKFDIIPENEMVIDGRHIWEKSNREMSEIRKKYFSFIFQQNNLMQNFTIWENAVIPQMIKGGSKQYRDTIKEIGLEQILTERKINIGELSGGQQQRLAFVRAFLPNFKIIFGDEPTGNLDPENADNLMRIIAEEIHGSNEKKTAIIVSHSLELSEKYADRIIKIQKQKDHQRDETMGVINADSVFEKNEGQWLHNKTTIAANELETLIKA